MSKEFVCIIVYLKNTNFQSKPIKKIVDLKFQLKNLGISMGHKIRDSQVKLTKNIFNPI